MLPPQYLEAALYHIPSVFFMLQVFHNEPEQAVCMQIHAFIKFLLRHCSPTFSLISYIPAVQANILLSDVQRQDNVTPIVKKSSSFLFLPAGGIDFRYFYAYFQSSITYYHE